MKSKLLILLALLAFGCGTSDSENNANNDKNNSANNGKGDNIGGDNESLCVGVRGNGDRIFSHFGALAKIHETYGPIDAIAGGSSASITSFITESIYMNPTLLDCGGEPCSSEVVGNRVALMLKSVSGYLEILGQTDEAVALFQIKAIVDLIQKNKAAIDELILGDKFSEARTQLLTIFESEELRSLINPELVALLQTASPFHTKDIWDSVKAFGSFKVDSDLILIRPGVISFEAVAEKVGRIGTFYAAMGPDNLAKWDTFLNECAEPSVGKTWNELDGTNKTNCTSYFREMATEWRTAYIADEANLPTRLDDKVGTALSAIISTSVITGESVAEFQKARTAYNNAAPIMLDVDFDDVKFGYFGPKTDLATIGENTEGFSDLKTDKFLDLGHASWRTALAFSPAEPGLSRALEMNDVTMVSAGGWSDLAPTTILKNLKCDQVILVTREGEVQGGFGPSVAGLLGMDSDTDNRLYDLDGDSSIKTSLNAADGVWCTNWDSVPSGNFAGHFADGYNAPLEAKSEFIKAAGYAKAVDSVNRSACTPGVAAPAVSED